MRCARFFENGGRRCRVVRVASEAALAGAASATLDVIDSNGGTGFTLAASSPGAWGNGLDVSVRAMTRGDTLIPVPAAPERSVAIDVGLFLPGDLVRLSQPGSPDACRLVASVDREARALVWTLPDLRARRPWEKPLAGFNSSRAIRVERIVHEIVVRESGRVVAIYGELGLHPASRRFIGDVLRPGRLRGRWAGSRRADRSHSAGASRRLRARANGQRCGPLSSDAGRS